MTASQCRFSVVLAAIFLLLSSPLSSQTNNKSPATKPPASTNPAPANPTTTPAKPASPAEIFKVTINASRVSVTRDGSYGVYADLENVSPEVVTIRAKETTLVVQPEVASPVASVGLERGIFPAQPFSTDPTKTDEMSIQPSEHYKVFWNLTSTPDKDAHGSESSWKKIQEYLGFVPGEYAFTVEGIVYAPNAKGESIAHTYTETTTLHVGLSQASTALAAFLGALLAYFVVALQPGRDFDQWRMKSASTASTTAAASADSSAPSNSLQSAGAWLLLARGWVRSAAVILRNALAAGLLGSALTIVASRLSDTQFPVKVSVNDFWGALTIGFVSYFIGNNLLATIIGRLAPPSKNPPTGTAGAGGPGVDASGAGNPPRANQPPAAGAEHLDTDTPPQPRVEEEVEVLAR